MFLFTIAGQLERAIESLGWITVISYVAFNAGSSNEGLKKNDFIELI